MSATRILKLTAQRACVPAKCTVRSRSTFCCVRASQLLASSTPDLARCVGARASAKASPAKAVAPPGHGQYETLIVLKPTLTDEERDQELARFESFLHAEECQDVEAIVRGRHRMAYPVKGHWEGIYVLFTFIAICSTVPKVQKLLSTPVAGAEDNILRHMTIRY